MRHSLTLLPLFLSLATGITSAQSLSLPDAPVPPASLVATAGPLPAVERPPPTSSSSDYPDPAGFTFNPAQQQSTSTQTNPHPGPTGPLDANGNPIPLSRQEPARILGFMPNFRSVSVGAAHTRPTWKSNFSIATRQSFDYSSFLFLGITSLSAEGLNEHPSLGKGIGGFYAYTWRGFIDKTDGTYLSAFFLPSLLHEDTRYYPLGDGHSVFMRSLYVISRQAVARDYNGHSTPNVANLGGKVLTQVISQYYYPDGTSSFPVLATKFGYSVMRDVGFSAIREFYPSIAGHYVRKHHEKAARQAARDAQSTHTTTP